MTYCIILFYIEAEIMSKFDLKITKLGRIVLFLMSKLFTLDDDLLNIFSYKTMS